MKIKLVFVQRPYPYLLVGMRTRVYSAIAAAQLLQRIPSPNTASTSLDEQEQFGTCSCQRRVHAWLV
jgi:hypothetical protein